jgi:aspartate/methionine/tyrosine aminotransferase
VAFPAWAGPGTVEAFCQAVLEAEGVMIVPGEMFGWPGRHFRVGLGRRTYAAALRQVEAWLHSGGPAQL